MNFIKTFKESHQLRLARKAAKKYNLDFIKKCCFAHQIHGISNKTPKHNEIVKVPMESGKTGLYKVTIDSCWGNTGQKDWYYEFQGYNNEQN